jgi:hypothetical protein
VSPAAWTKAERTKNKIKIKRNKTPLVEGGSEEQKKKKKKGSLFGDLPSPKPTFRGSVRLHQDAIPCTLSHWK